MPGSWVIDPTSSASLKIPEDIISGSANTWNNTKAIISKYFENTKINEPTFKHFYENTLRALNNLQDLQGSKFGSRCLDYLKAKEVKLELIEEFIKAERRINIKKGKAVMEQEAETASMGVKANKKINITEQYSKKKKRKVCT